jgi:hypothetical protein
LFASSGRGEAAPFFFGPAAGLGLHAVHRLRVNSANSISPMPSATDRGRAFFVVDLPPAAAFRLLCRCAQPPPRARASTGTAPSGPPRHRGSGRGSSQAAGRRQAANPVSTMWSLRVSLACALDAPRPHDPVPLVSRCPIATGPEQRSARERRPGERLEGAVSERRPADTGALARGTFRSRRSVAQGYHIVSTATLVEPCSPPLESSKRTKTREFAGSNGTGPLDCRKTEKVGAALPA